MVFDYLAYGLSFRSNRSIPGLQSSAPSDQCDLEVKLEYPVAELLRKKPLPYITRYVSSEADSDGVPQLIVQQSTDQTLYHWVYRDGTEFLLDHRGSKIWAQWPPGETIENMATYLLGPILGFVLRLRGVTCLHASAVAVRGEAIAFLGAAGAGKSTTAAVFATLGHPVLSDDIVALTDRGSSFFIQPGYPGLRLWPESVNALYGSTEVLPRLTPTWDKRYLNLTRKGYRFQSQPLPLAGIYILGERSSDPTAPFIETVPAQASLITLVGNTYVNYVLDRRMRAHEFEVLGRLVKYVRLRRVVPHADSAYLSKLCDLILDDLSARPNYVHTGTGDRRFSERIVRANADR
ncbi:MAG: hypothetical protein ACREQA_23560 [Candidatus Binatia bacterium]